MRPGVRRTWFAFLLAVMSAIVLAGGSAEAERAQEGNLIVSLNGGITPRTFPRQRPAPGSVQLSRQGVPTHKPPVPRVNWIRLQLAWRGVLDTEGLPVCPRVRLIGTDSHTALRRCDGAQVGRGRLYAEIFVPHQAPFKLHARLIAFNGRTGVGR